MRRTPACCTIVCLFALGCQTTSPESEDATHLGAQATAHLGRQQAFADAAVEFGVPENVLLAVSYLESRWDANAGQISRSAGYGPMHLTDPDAAPRRHDGTEDPRSDAAHHHDGTEDPRGDEARPPKQLHSAPPAASASLHAQALQAPQAQTPGTPSPSPSASLAASPPATLELAAQLTGSSKESLSTDPGENVRGGAALLAHYQRELAGAGRPSARSADWYGAVARYSGAIDAATARQFADEVFATIADGAERVTDDGERIVLPAQPELRPPKVNAARQDDVECPSDLACDWIPAPYEDLGGGDYGNHDLSNRPRSQRIAYIVIHDIEGYYDTALRMVQDPAYVSWQYTLRSSDGHVAQHAKAKDVCWQAGNWYVNAKSIGLEHEGFAAKGTWYTEAMYRSSAKLVRYLALRNGIPLDRAHIIGHDNVQGTIPRTVSGMHWDPGPYWDWAHYFELLKAPLRATGNARSGLVTIKPDYATNRPAFVGCEAGRPTEPCPVRSSSAIILRTEPRDDAPLLKDIGTHPPNGTSTLRVSDIGSRVSTGQQYAVAERQGDWTAIWYLGQKGWFYNPPAAPNALPAIGFVITPKEGKPSVPVYGRAYPEAEAYPEHIAPQPIVPLQYEMLAGQRYSFGMLAATEYFSAVTFDPANHVVVEGDIRYYQIQFGHRIAYVMASDVDLLPSPIGAP